MFITNILYYFIDKWIKDFISINRNKDINPLIIIFKKLLKIILLEK